MQREPKTPDLVERARAWLDVDPRDDDFAVFMSLFAEDAVYDASQPGVSVFVGAAAIRRFAEDWLASYEEWESDWEEAQDLGNRVVFGVNRQDGRLAGSEGRVQERYALTFTFDAADRFARVDVSRDIDEARAAAERRAEERG
jgi:SnoaL-like domain